MSKNAQKKNVNWIAPFVLLIIICVALELITRLTAIPEYILPPPSQVFMATVKDFRTVILPDFLFTLKVVFIGFVSATVLGMGLAAVFSQFSFIQKAATPVVIFFVITPMMTLIPLLMLWLGNDPNLRIIVVIIQATPIICLNTISGFTTVETDKLELGRSIGTTKSQFFSKVIFMNAMPRVFTGIKLGVIFAITGAIGADFVAKGIGMGNRIINYSKYIAIDRTYGCIIIIALLGIILYMTVEKIEHKIIVWKK